MSLIAFLPHKSLANPYTDAVNCIAANIYFEARNQPMLGRIAVALVVLNRAEDHRYPDTVCAVVYQGPTKPSWKDPNKHIPIRHRCQFSWWCDGKKEQITDKDAWNDAVRIAKMTLAGFPDFTQGSTHYHATYVTPRWATRFLLTYVIGDHVFYRWDKKEMLADNRN